MQTLEGHLQNVVGHVAEGTRTEVPPSTEVPRRVRRVIVAILCRSDEGIPVHRTGDGRLVGWRSHALRPDRTIGECLDAGHLANHTIPEPVQCLASAFTRSTLVTLLRGYLVLLGQLREQTTLIGIERHRLLQINMLAGGYSLCCDDGMRVVGRCNHHGIGLVEHFVEHLAIVVVGLGLRILLEDMLGILPVAVA